jgi:acyl carrier protein
VYATLKVDFDTEEYSMEKTVCGVRRLVVSVVANVLERPEKDVRLSADLVCDLGASELDMAEILTALEYRLGITIPDRDEVWGRIRTIHRLSWRVLAHCRRQHGRFALA